MTLPLWLSATFLVLLSLSGRVLPAHAESPAYTVDVASSSREITLAARPDAKIPLTLIRTGPTAGQVRLFLSPFVSAQGSGTMADVQLMVGDLVADRSPIPISAAPLVPLKLAVHKMPVAGNYIGSLVVLEDKKDPLTFRITLASGAATRPAAIEVSPRTITLAAERDFRSLYTTPKLPTATFTITEKTGVWPAAGITVRLEEGSESIGSTDRFKFSMNRDPVSLTGRDTVLTLAPGESKLLTMEVDALPAGEHSATLRFRTPGAADEDAAKLAVKAKVSEPAWVAVLLLLAALVLSFFATKFIVMFRQRTDFRKRIHDAETPWLAKMDSVLPVVWVRDVLNQTKILGARWWLSGHPVIDARLKQITTLVGVLEKAHLTQLDIAAQNLPVFIDRRARAALSAIVARLQAATLSDPRANQLGPELDGLSAWLTPSKLPNAYRESIAGAMAALCCEVRPEEIPDVAARTVITELLTEVRARAVVVAKSFSDAQTALTAATSNATAAKQVQASARATLEAAQARSDAAAAAVAKGGGDIEQLKAAAAEARKAADAARVAAMAADEAAARASKAEKDAWVPMRLDELMAVEETYARLKLLWERRAEAEFADLLALHRNGQSLDTLFQRADQALWEYLIARGVSIKVERPSSVGDHPAQWEPLTFSVVPPKPAIDKWFLFRRGLDYNWTFLPVLNNDVAGEPFRGQSKQPEVVAYAGKGVVSISATVTISYAKAPPAHPGPVLAQLAPQAIVPSSEMNATTAFERVEMLSWGVAGVIAMISGLWFLYAKNPTFGRFEDYVGLIAWGVGVDQAKNLLQVFQGLVQNWGQSPAKT